MANRHTPGPWKAVLVSGSWQIQTESGRLIATVENTGNEKANATLLKTSPYMLKALEALMELIGDEDLPDNGELSGAAICDMGRAAVELATKGNISC